MKLKILIAALMLTPQIIAQSYEKIHSAAIVVDTHNDRKQGRSKYGTKRPKS